MDRVNLHEPSSAYDDTDPDGYRAGMDRFGIGSARAGSAASVYELPPGQSVCPYHYEFGDEEWLVVLSRAADDPPPRRRGRAEPGDTVCFPEGPTAPTRSPTTARRPSAFLMLLDPAAAVRGGLSGQRQDRHLVGIRRTRGAVPAREHR